MIRRLFWHWRLRVWHRRLALRLLAVQVQEEHPIGGPNYISNEQGIKAYSTEMDRKVIRARHYVMLYASRLNQPTKARALKS